MEFKNLDEYEEKARDSLSKNALNYYRNGTGKGLSLQWNRSSYDRIRIYPHCLRDVSKRSAKCHLLGIDMPMPVGVSPTAMQKVVHPKGEIASAKAAQEAGIVFTLSCMSTTSLEEVAAATPNSPKWFQLYIYIDRDLTRNLIRRAEKAGYRAIVVTVDTPMFGFRRPKNNLSLPPHLNLENFTSERIQNLKEAGENLNLGTYLSKGHIIYRCLTWEDIKWLVSETRLPVLAKGILRADDAIQAMECGCKGIIVSNHGGRQLDSVPPTIDALPGIVTAVGSKVAVIVDGGVRQGTDVFKAIALGAKMVLLGRPIIWGLTVGGQDGVVDVLKIIQTEFDVAMAVSGCSKISDITQDLIGFDHTCSKL
ncbi:2-Hydroxyacid oxidase 1-like [Phlebotomus argentipes]|uniref:2-Hydroxyacid oxidase 1-like n=1 Tax=Phlebotomus argentipes TaxID=94469 RepID=UPI002892E3B2|nr:2-Hydroxyacid oxidase 1-like [Phlebotomus argentipes]